jgi:hypothetical protein
MSVIAFTPELCATSGRHPRSSPIFCVLQAIKEPAGFSASTENLSYL